MIRNFTRRDFMLMLGAASTGLLAAACSSAAAPAQPTAAPAKPASGAATAAPAAGPAPHTAPAAAKTSEWDALVDAAKKEGKVVIQTPVGAGYRDGADAFMKAFPVLRRRFSPSPMAPPSFRKSRTSEKPASTRLTSPRQLSC